MKKIIIIAVLFVISFFLYGYYVNTSGYVINEQKILANNIANSFDGFKIIQFSDTLIESEKDIKNLNNIVSSINELNPDIVIFTGDLVKSSYTLDDNKIKSITNSLKNIKCNLYKYAIIGDNDQKHLSDYKKILEDGNFILLDNDYKYLFYKDINPIKIIGITNESYNTSIFDNEEGITPTYNIVLTHYPDYADKITQNNIDIIFSGHSLNGQIKLPFIGAIIKKTGAKKYFDSYYEINDTKLYISGGIGTEKIHFRFLNKPEINVYNIEK